VRKDHPNYNPKSLSEGGRILEAMAKGHFTQYELKFLICVYRWSFAFQRRWTPTKEKEEWRSQMGLNKFAFAKTKKQVIDGKIVVCTDNGKNLSMRFETDTLKWKLLPVQVTTRKSITDQAKLSLESTGLSVGVTELSAGITNVLCKGNSIIIGDDSLDETIDKDLLDEGEVSPLTPSLPSPLSFKKEELNPKNHTPNYPVLFKQDQINEIEQGKERLRNSHDKRRKEVHRRLIDQQKENVEKTGRPEG
jgi:hypothetical protein